jgi:hypothetical protein
MKDRNDKIIEARRLLRGDPPQGKPRTWVVTCYDGKEECKQSGYPDEVQEHDKILRIIEPSGNSPHRTVKDVDIQDVNNN